MSTNRREHEFTLALTGIAGLDRKSIDALYESGCDDATLAIRNGRVFATFAREADSLKDAILSAIQCIRSAKIGADVLRVDYCNLVTQAEIARRIGRTRQIVHMYMTGQRGPGGFPGPACQIADEASLWYWCEVAHWLCDNGMLRKDEFRDAEEVDTINLVLEVERAKQSNPVLTKEVFESVTSTP